MQIEITDTRFAINGVEMHFPLDILQLKTLLGEPRHVIKQHNQIYTWDTLGMLAYSKKGREAEGLTFDLRVRDFDFSPASPFTGQLTIKGMDYQAYFQQNRKSARKASKWDEGGTLTVGNIDVWVDMEEGVMTDVELSQHTPPEPKVYSDKYKHQPISGEKIEFADFNFKLAVIQELYDKNLLTPVFDLYEFVKNYQGREIDIEAEGYEFIPEVTAYFEALEIDRKLAPHVTEIYQDGGNDIYLQVLRFWDGEDDTFNIKNFEDVKHFPNLKRMTLFYADNMAEIQAQLAEKGITAEPL
ncbi:DUF6892 domain-containing protein [Chitinophaga qingshengii]|uniref:Uncharacterized protein n=1 Tax=Chitinophaga qingshengii TaxID=1569794 RepID=A0ABR7TRQ5_9BACT|nr:hypothetical protein [Chitinophaga qingshengii]MBC9933166.1 hypothetical protein [Chitinophaga qingshengii]